MQIPKAIICGVVVSMVVLTAASAHAQTATNKDAILVINRVEIKKFRPQPQSTTTNLNEEAMDHQLSFFPGDRAVILGGEKELASPPQSSLDGLKSFAANEEYRKSVQAEPWFIRSESVCSSYFANISAGVSRAYATFKVRDEEAENLREQYGHAQFLESMGSLQDCLTVSRIKENVRLEADTLWAMVELLTLRSSRYANDLQKARSQRDELWNSVQKADAGYDQLSRIADTLEMERLSHDSPEIHVPHMGPEPDPPGVYCTTTPAWTYNGDVSTTCNLR